MDKKVRSCAVGGLLIAAAAGAVYGGMYGTSTEEMTAPEEIFSQTGKSSTEIILSDNGITVSGDGVSVSGNTVMISKAGNYSVSGMLSDGQIYINAGSSDSVVLSLNNAEISNSSDAAIYVENAGNTLLVLEEGTVNRFQSGTAVDLSTMEDGTDSNASGGAVYAKDDLAVTGTGTLQVFGYINNGIHTTNALTIDSGNIEVTAVNNGIKGKDSITVSGGAFSVRSGGDGIKSDDTAGTGYGVIMISGGSFSIESDSDGIQAETELEISGGEFSIISGSGSGNAVYRSENNGSFGGFSGVGINENADQRPESNGDFERFGGFDDGRDNENSDFKPGINRGLGGGRGNDNSNFKPEINGDFGGFGRGWQDRVENEDMDDDPIVSTKGIKCSGEIRITGGNISVDSCDDAVHSNDCIYITGGNFSLASGDDGIHADKELNIEDGNISITRSYEGLEGNIIRLSGGNIDVTAYDDGINAYGGDDRFGGRGGEASKITEEMPQLYFSGADITIDASGDGIDSNGSIYVEGGTVIVNGPVDSMNGAIDSGTENGGVCAVSGGTVLAIGSSGMDEGFSTQSEQCSFRHSLGAAISEGSEIIISDLAGNELFRHTAIKNASSIVFSSPDLKIGETYLLSINGQTIQIEQSSVSVSSGERSRGPRGNWR